MLMTITIPLSRIIILRIPLRPPLVKDISRRDALFRSRRHPLAALPRRHAQDVHHVHFFERLAFTFDDAEVDDQNRDEETPREDVSVREVDVARDERSEESNEEVPEPVGGGC